MRQLFRLVIVGNLLPGRFCKERQVALPLWRRHRTEVVAVPVRYWLCCRKPLLFQMVEHVELVPDIVQRAPLETICTQVIGAPISSFHLVGVVEPSGVELALDDLAHPKAGQYLVHQGFRRKD
jgi:hypothetical protein